MHSKKHNFLAINIPVSFFKFVEFKFIISCFCVLFIYDIFIFLVIFYCVDEIESKSNLH
jgi:hypothetical protein